MNLQLGEVQSFVSDLTVAKKFYADTLGLDLVDEGHHWLIFDINGVEFIIMRVGNPGRLKKSYGTECGTVLCLQSENIHRDYETLKRRGVNFFSEIIEVSPGRFYIPFQDPDGNLLELIQK